MNWLLLIHQIPAKPTYFRAKIWRRLQQVGAVPVKQAVYVMPHSEASHEDLSWIAKEIIESGGEAILLESRFLEGLSDEQVVALFQKARRADYETIMRDGQGVMDLRNGSGGSDVSLLDCKASLTKMRKAFAAASAIDFFPDGEQSKVEAFLADMETILRKTPAPTLPSVELGQALTGKTWVTQGNLYVDRMASGWFIRRFIDTEAQFKFVKGTSYVPAANELRFDMVEAEYTHQGDHCTFEVLVQTFMTEDQGLGQLAKLIHDIDLKDEAYGLAETPGVHALLDAIASNVSDDLQRIEQAGLILDGLLLFFNGKVKSV